MSFYVYFEFSTGLSAPLEVPRGTKAGILSHIAYVERNLGLECEQYGDNRPHWKTTDFASITDALLCETVEAHNRWVRQLHDDFGTWFREPVKDGETLTPEDARGFWRGLRILRVPPKRWTSDYYRARMETAYEVMRGRETEGVKFDAKPLTPEQAGSVVRLFEQWLDTHDIRLEVPRGRDELYDSDEYQWCERCGAVVEDAWEGCRKRPCPLRQEMKELGELEE